MKKLLALISTTFLALLLPAVALASEVGGVEEEEFDPSHEWMTEEWIPIHLGPLDLSITKPVVYLLLGAAITCVGGVLLMRARLRVDPDRRQTVGEIIYDIAQTQIAEQGLPHKAIARWFPYVASLFLFIRVVNLLGFIPLPLSDETFNLFGVDLPTFAIYAATSTLSVTLALALMTWIFTHIEGIRHNGAVGYFKSWIPDVPKGMLVADRAARDPRPVHAADQPLRPALREHARRPHADPHVHRAHLRPRVPRRRGDRRPGGDGLLPLRGRDRVRIQAFIFAALSAIYIGSAIEPEH